MTGRLAYTFKVSAAALTLLVATLGYAHAEEGTSPKSEETAAANSLKSILSQASEQGLIKLEADAQQQDSVAPRPRENVVGNVGISECSVSGVFDLSDYGDVDDFKQVLETKNSQQSYETVADIMELAKQYMALGLGTEVAALSSSYSGNEAKLLGALGNVIDGVATGYDVDAILAYKTCNQMSGFWSKVAYASREFKDQTETDWDLTLEERKILLDMPEHLKSILIIRLGIHAGELELKTLSDQLLALIEPQSRRGLLPQIKDDDRLYLYALVRQMKGDPTSAEILKYLGRKDGVYRTRALLKLVETEDENTSERYDEFSADLLSVQQQYRGSAPARKASLEVVKHQATQDQFIYAIDLALQEFSAVDMERFEAVNVIGDGVKSGLQSESSREQLHALNGYMHAPSFFSKYTHVADLKSYAYERALELNLPELALKIPTDIVDPSSSHAKARKLAEAQVSYKQGDFGKAVELAKDAKGNVRNQDILLKAALKLESQLKQANVAATLSESPEKTRLKADLALQNSRWAEAQSALKTLAEVEVDNDDIKQKLAIVDYVASDDAEQQKRAKSDTVADMEMFNADVSADIDLVKAYLKNG